MEVRRPVILLVENDEADVFLFRRALSQLNFTGTVRRVGSVGQARAYLENSGEFNDRDYYPIPDLIVSDMHLPGFNGNDFLAWMRQHKEFAAIPLMFLSGTFMPDDKLRAESLGASAFYVKSGDINVVRERVRSMIELLGKGHPPER